MKRNPWSKPYPYHHHLLDLVHNEGRVFSCLLLSSMMPKSVSSFDFASPWLLDLRPSRHPNLHLPHCNGVELFQHDDGFLVALHGVYSHSYLVKGVDVYPYISHDPVSEVETEAEAEVEVEVDSVSDPSPPDHVPSRPQHHLHFQTQIQNLDDDSCQN